jgi:hypothetical protein
MTPKIIAKIIIWVLGTLMAFFSITSFAMFILEEAVQSVGFGLYVMKGCDVYDKSLAFQKSEVIVQKILLTYETLSNLNPIASLWFDVYFESVAFQMDCYRIIYTK